MFKWQVALPFGRLGTRIAMLNCYKYSDSLRHSFYQTVLAAGNKERIMDWLFLIIAGVFEIIWATGLKYTEGFTRLWPSMGTLAAMAVSMVLLAQALKTIPVGTGYAIWTGIGAAGTAVMGIVLFGESRQVLRLLCIGLIVAGIVGLKFSSEP
jgi:quaternary ammonium compound-resistance protein SugE